MFFLIERRHGDGDAEEGRNEASLAHSSLSSSSSSCSSPEGSLSGNVNGSNEVHQPLGETTTAGTTTTPSEEGVRGGGAAGEEGRGQDASEGDRKPRGGRTARRSWEKGT